MDPTPLALLRSVSFFQGLDDQALAPLAARVRRRKFRAGEALFHEGDPGATLYVVVSGSVNIQTLTSGGEPVHLALRGPGEPFGEMALIDGKPRMADAVTASPCELLMLDRSEFVRCVEETPRVAFGVMACLADRLREAAHQLAAYQSQDVLGRLSAALLELVEAHGVEDEAGGRRIDVPLPQQELAGRIGTTRESVNRALSRLKQVHAIRMEGRKIVVLDSARLRRYSVE